MYSDAGSGARVNSVRLSDAESTGDLQYVNNDYQTAGVTPAVAARMGHCIRKQDSHRQRSKRSTVHCLHRLYRLKTPRHLLRSCAVGGHLESGERTGIITQPDKTDTPNGTTFPSRRCAPRALRADYCRMILPSRDSRAHRHSKGVELRKYEHGSLL